MPTTTTAAADATASAARLRAARATVRNRKAAPAARRDALAALLDLYWHDDHPRVRRAAVSQLQAEWDVIAFPLLAHPMLSAAMRPDGTLPAAVIRRFVAKCEYLAPPCRA